MSIYMQPDMFFRYYGRQTLEDILPVCCTIDNYFVPLFAGIDGKYIHHENKQAIIYNIKKSNYLGNNIPRTVTRFVTMLHSNYPATVLSHVEDASGTLSSIYYGTMKHFIYFTDPSGKIIPLYALCAGNRDIYSLTKENIVSNYNKLFLLINPLIFTPFHKVLGTRVKLIIKYFESIGVNIVYSSNLSNLCLKETTFSNTFRTIEEKALFIRTIKQRVGLHVPPLPERTEPIIIPAPEPIATPVPDISEFNDISVNEVRQAMRATNVVVGNNFTLNSNGVMDSTVISAATHQRVTASFIDRSSFPINSAEMIVIDDTVAEVQPTQAPISNRPAPDPSILNDPSLSVNNATNIPF